MRRRKGKRMHDVQTPLQSQSGYRDRSSDKDLGMRSYRLHLAETLIK